MTRSAPPDTPEPRWAFVSGVIARELHQENPTGVQAPWTGERAAKAKKTHYTIVIRNTACRSNAAIPTSQSSDIGGRCPRASRITAAPVDVHEREALKRADVTRLKQIPWVPPAASLSR